MFSWCLPIELGLNWVYLRFPCTFLEPLSFHRVENAKERAPSCIKGCHCEKSFSSKLFYFDFSMGNMGNESDYSSWFVFSHMIILDNLAHWHNCSLWLYFGLLIFCCSALHAQARLRSIVHGPAYFPATSQSQRWVQVPAGMDDAWLSSALVGEHHPPAPLAPRA